MHTRLPFQINANKNVFSFNRIFVDIWGGSHSLYIWCPLFFDNSWYFLQNTWLYLMRLKTDTFNCIKHFLALSINQFQTTVRHIRTDNGIEFLSTQTQALFYEHEIIHERTCVNAPQQNGVVEHKHPHLLNVARCLSFQAHIPLTFWVNVSSLRHIWSIRLLSPNFDHKTPYELLFHKPPSYEHFHVFGCLCYAYIEHVHCDKFSPHGSWCLFLGYPLTHKAYRVYNLESKRNFLSRDVMFVENISPY